MPCVGSNWRYTFGAFGSHGTNTSRCILVGVAPIGLLLGRVCTSMYFLGVKRYVIAVAPAEVSVSAPAAEHRTHRHRWRRVTRPTGRGQ